MAQLVLDRLIEFHRPAIEEAVTKATHELLFYGTGIARIRLEIIASKPKE